MAVITQIRRNAKDKRRCTIMVDGAFFCACHEDVLFSLGLRRGMELTEELTSQLRCEERKLQLRQKVWAFASYKPRTESQVRTKCQSLGMTDEETTDVIEWLTSFHQINDEEYARRFIEASRERKPMSNADIRTRLRRKGISNAVLDVVLAPSTDNDDFAAARRVAERKLLSLRDSDNARERLTRFLAYRRYPWHVIRRVVDDVLTMSVMVLVTVIPLWSSADTNCHRVALPWTVNQWQPTTMPVVSADGQTLYIDRKYHPDNSNGTSDADEVWISNRDSSTAWSIPERLNITESIPQPQVVFHASLDGLRLLVAGEYQTTGRTCFAILHRTSRRAPFTRATVVNVKGALNLAGRYFATMSDDGSDVIIAVNQPNGMGELDLFHTSLCGTTWSNLEPLGTTVNTTGFDGAPHLARDGATLYFASNGHEPRRGKLDLYVTRRIGNRWTEWTNPRWLGPCVNTVGDETSIWLNEDGTRAFITSWDAEESRQLLYDVHLPVDARPEAWCSLELHVRDAAQGTPIPSATIVISDASNEPCATRVDTDEYGVAIVALLPHQRYTITTQAQGYTSVPQTVRLQQLDSLTPLRLTAYLFDTTAPLASLYFERGEAEVTSTERDRLRALVDSFGIRAIAFRVTGYTDELGSKPFNQTLSAKRANAVVEALVAMGFSPERIISEGRGVEIPKVALGMRENPQSRRVDIFAASAPPRATTPRQSHQVPPSSSGRRPR